MQTHPIAQKLATIAILKHYLLQYNIAEILQKHYLIIIIIKVAATF